MENLIGYGLRNDDIGQMQVGDTITEILVNGWWLITVEECMTNDHGKGYLLELLVNSRQTDLTGTGFMTIDDVVDHLFAGSWVQAIMLLGLNIDHFKDRSPRPEPVAVAKCGYCGVTTFPHLCLGSATELNQDGCKVG